MRIGHVGLSVHMYRFGLCDTPLCECELPETVSHVLVDCPLYISERINLVTYFNQINIDYNIKNLLCGAKCNYAIQNVIMHNLKAYPSAIGKINIF